MSDQTAPWRPDGQPSVLDGRYRLEQRLGGGAVADVFRGVDERLERPVAVKLFRGDAAEQLQRHEAEMRTLAALDHPNLVGVFDAGTDAETDQPYLVMQLVEGSTLADELRAGPIAADRTARVGAALADALDYVHGQGLVHRDVKPANVLLSHDGRVHLADFGIARLVDAAHVTRTGDVVGTPAYFAPEQVSASGVGPPADVYALGLVLLECRTGRRAFDGTSMEVAMARLARDPEVPASLGAPWVQLLQQMTAREPSARPTASDVAERLRPLADSRGADHTALLTPPPTATAVRPPATAVAPTPVPAPAAARELPPPGPARRSSRTAWVVAVVVALVAAVAVAVAVAAHQGSGGPAGYTPGTPTLPGQLEVDVEHLEKLVRR